VVFMPGKYVFPGGRVDKSDNRVPVAAPIPGELEANLLKGSPKIAPSRARALAVAAIREACEETGLCLGCKVDKPVKLDGAWQPFAEAGLLPDPSGLFLIARAITPPGRVRRFDIRRLHAAGQHPHRRLALSRRLAGHEFQLRAHEALASRRSSAAKFDAFFMADHMAVLNMPMDALKRSHTVTSFEPFTLLSALSQVTDRISA
jgi:8-oxo-dGTP pyrophosphatase MutT (NUDIX family)